MSNQQLWAVHVIGPDDLIAASSEEEAQKQTDEINALNLEHVKAEVVEWPYSAEEHTESLQREKND